MINIAVAGFIAGLLVRFPGRCETGRPTDSIQVRAGQERRGIRTWLLAP